MFITLTIDTNQKKKARLKFQKRKFNPAMGWHKKVFMKKRNLWQRFKAWRRSIRPGQYKLGGQIAMF